MCCASPGNTEKRSNDDIAQNRVDTFRLYTLPGKGETLYAGFSSRKAINSIAAIENEYFNNYKRSQSRYYGTMWYESAIAEYGHHDSLSVFEAYKRALASRNERPDSMHCTIYAIRALEAGLDSNFLKMKKYHQQIWDDREYAGWSVGYILTTYFNWSAYLMVSKHSEEYDRCVKNFRKHRKYYVWKQPDIPIKQLFDFDEDTLRIAALLNKHEFGWGFSNQGLHTWITRFDRLKECNWAGSPSKKYDRSQGNALFKKTKFTSFKDYASHIVIFPPELQEDPFGETPENRPGGG